VALARRHCRINALDRVLQRPVELAALPDKCLEALRLLVESFEIIAARRALPRVRLVGGDAQP
jgi:hypothetical protein